MMTMCVTQSTKNVSNVEVIIGDMLEHGTLEHKVQAPHTSFTLRPTGSYTEAKMDSTRLTQNNA